MILVTKQIKQIFSDEKPVFADEGNLRLLNAAIPDIWQHKTGRHPGWFYVSKKKQKSMER